MHSPDPRTEGTLPPYLMERLEAWLAAQPEVERVFLDPTERMIAKLAGYDLVFTLVEEDND